jgi:hypothetical protein
MQRAEYARCDQCGTASNAKRCYFLLFVINATVNNVTTNTVIVTITAPNTIISPDSFCKRSIERSIQSA